VPIEFFVGRYNEVRFLIEKIERAREGRLQVAFLTGERGIGKSSLASYVRVLGDNRYGIVGVHAFLGGVDSLEDMVRQVFDRLLKESIGKSWHEQARDFFRDHVKQVGLFGITLEFEASSKELTRTVHDFAPVLRNLCARLQGEKSGILLVLDDINGLARLPQFANWLKSLADEIATSQKPLPLCLLLVGLEERRQELIQLQPSLARVFDLVEIRAWSDQETTDFFRNAFSRVGIRVEDEALKLMSSFCGGLPVLAQEIGDAAFNRDTDGVIDADDASEAVLQAAEIIGRKYLQPQVLEAIRSQRYRGILRKLATAPTFPSFAFSRHEALSHLSDAEVRVFDNFLQRMKRLGVIKSGPDRGTYRFTNLLHALYFRMEARRALESTG